MAQSRISETRDRAWRGTAIRTRIDRDGGLLHGLVALSALVRPSVLTPLVGLLLLWGLWWQLVAHFVLVRATHLDFGRFYFAVKLWLQGGSLYGHSFSTWLQLQTDGVHLWNLNPPHVSLVILPLTALSLEQAFVAWTALNILAVALAVQWTLDALSIQFRCVPARVRWGWFALAIGCAPTLAWLGTGQLTGLLTLIVTGAWIAARQDRWTHAGIWLGIAIISKPFLAPLGALLLVRRQWRGSLYSAISGLTCLAIGVAVFGWSEHVAWLRVLRDVQWPWLPINSSLTAPLARVAYVLGGHVVTAPGVIVATQIGSALGIGLVIFSLGAARRTDLDQAWLLVTIACLLASPLGWLYYWWLAIPPMIACWVWIRRAFWLSLAGWVIPMYWAAPAVFLGSVWTAITVGSLYTWTLLVLWIATLRSATATQDALHSQHSSLPNKTAL